MLIYLIEGRLRLVTCPLCGLLVQAVEEQFHLMGRLVWPCNIKYIN